MSDTYNSGVRPIIDNYLLEKSKEKRDYGDYWSASSAGYCYKKNIFDRLKVPSTKTEQDQARQQRVFEAGHTFHEMYQRITKDAGVSLVQELEVQDEDLMIRGHIDDIIQLEDKFFLYDYKTRNSRSFSFATKPMPTHELQIATYKYILDKGDKYKIDELRVLNSDKDTLRQVEVVYEYTPELKKKVEDYWTGLNKAWAEFNKTGLLPKCTCETFMATERYNDYFYDGESCSTKWLKLKMEEKNETK